MTRIDIDLTLCNGYGNCLAVAPDLFDIDPNTNVAFVTVTPAPDDLDTALDAAAECPARAITVTP